MDQPKNECQAPAANQQMTDTLTTIRTWTRLIAICGFIATAVMVLVGLLTSVTSLIFSASRTNHMPAGIGVIYIIGSFLYGLPSWFLLKSSQAVGRYAETRGEKDLDDCLSRMASFWRIVGIMLIVTFAVMGLGIIAAIVIPNILRVTGR